MDSSDKRHLEKLIHHGAKVADKDGLKPLSLFFAEKAMEECRRTHCHAIIYDLVMPDIEDPLAIAIRADGHIDSGSADMVLKTNGLG